MTMATTSDSCFRNPNTVNQRRRVGDRQTFLSGRRCRALSSIGLDRPKTRATWCARDSFTWMEGSDVAGTLVAALDGDQLAWRRLVDEHNGLLWWIARSYGLDNDAAADLVQTMWLLVLRRGRSIQKPERFAAWLSTAARREALARSKSRARTIPRAEFDDRSDDTAASIGEALIDADDLGEALSAFRQLDDACQNLLRLVCAVPPLSYAEIAARIGKSPGYIGPTRARCLERLRSMMSPLLGPVATNP